MGTTISSEGSSTSQATPTDAEKEMQKLQLQQYKTNQPAQTQLQGQALALGSQLMTSFNDPNSQQWQSLIGGVTQQQQNSMVSEADRYLTPQLQSQGLYDSGTAATARQRSATDIYNQNAQFNVGALQNALNLALGGQAQVQSGTSQNTSQLASQLAGLRTVTNTSSQTQSSNPFLNSFYGGLGSQLGQGIGSLGTTWVGNTQCWVAAEIFGGWYEPKTCAARFYVAYLAPIWFSHFYTTYGERIAKFIHNKPIFKLILRPLFEYFALKGKFGVKYAY